MKNDFLDYEVGTVLKEIYMDGDVSYYIVGAHFIYTNDYDDPKIRPHKFDTRYCYIADEDEKEQFIEDLKKNHLIWNEETGEVTREYEEITLNVKVKVKPGMNVNGLLEKLNSQVENPFYVYGMKFEDAIRTHLLNEPLTGTHKEFVDKQSLNVRNRLKEVYGEVLPKELDEQIDYIVSEIYKTTRGYCARVWNVEPSKGW